MGTRLCIVAKVIGLLKDQLQQDLMKWNRQEPTRGNLTCSADTNQHLDSELEMLEKKLEHRLGDPSVVFWTKHLDPWTIFPIGTIAELLTTIGVEHEIIQTDKYELLYLLCKQNISDIVSAVFQQHLLQPNQELRLLLYVFSECVSAWSLLFEQHAIGAGVIILCRVLGGSWLDSDVLRRCQNDGS